MKNILEVDQLNKSFDTYDNELKRFLVWFGLSQKPKITKNVLESVSFNIAQGEAVGIVGRNGAGKSTLLKIITGTLTPNSGYVRAAGQVSAILELGMGFSPDMTGRQNAYHSAGLMGYTHSQIKEVIDDIEEFAEIGEYFEQPVRTYSSGMQARLSFSVATAFRPDLLIVDEALSVGDVYFQSKCFARMNNMKSLGTSILLVSHDTQAIRTFCSRAILIDKGKVILSGEPKIVMQRYESMLDGFMIDTKKITNNKKAELEYFQIIDCNGENIKSILCGEKAIIRSSFKIKSRLDDPHVGIRIADRFGNSVFETNTYCMRKKILSREDEFLTVEFIFRMNLGAGDYTFDIALVNKGYDRQQFEEHILLEHNIGSIKVVENKDDIIFHGYYNMNPEFRVLKVNEST